MSNQKKKNANYTQKSRQEATRDKMRTVRAGNRSGDFGARLDRNRPISPITRFFLGKTNILEYKFGNWQFPYVLLAFLISFIGGFLAMMACRDTQAAEAAAKGQKYVFSILHSDAYYQYYPFFVHFRNTIRSGGNLLYTWNIGMGTDYIGLFAYYVASPLNWFSALIPESQLMNYYNLLVPIRMGFAGMFFALFLKKVFDKNDISIVLFGGFYASCAWVSGYLWNTMWLDTFALLPLVILGTYNLLKHRKFILYTVALFFSIFINYYIGFFTCIFTLLVFICYEICNWKNFETFLIDLGLMALFTILAIGMTAFLSLPTFAALQTTSSTGGTFPKKLELLITKDQSFDGFLDAMLTVSTNSFAATTPNYSAYASAGGLPNIYCGVFAGMLSLVFFTCKQIKWRERIAALVLVLFLAASFVIVQLDYIWHGFHVTNAIPNRFSFIYSFVILFLAYRAWTLRRRFEPWQIMVSLGITFAGLLISPGLKAATKATATEGSFINETLFVSVNFGLILLYTAALMLYSFRDYLPKKAWWKQKQAWYRKLHLRRSLGALAMVTIIAVELIFNFVCFGEHLVTYNAANDSGYPRNGTDTAKAVAYMQSAEGPNTFYRAEAAQHQTYNDGMLNGYHGVSTFSSAANVKVTNYMKALGISGQDNYNRFVYEEASPVSHLFMNLKYIIERNGWVEKNDYFTDVYQSGKVHLMKNDYYLPLGFMVDQKLKDTSFEAPNDLFAFQNKLLSDALGREVKPWRVIPHDSVKGTGGVEITSTTHGACYYTVSSNGYVEYTYQFDSAGLFCVNYHLPGKNYYYAYHLAKGGSAWTSLHNDKHNGLPFIGSVCQVEPGDKIKIKVSCKPGDSKKNANLIGALLDQSVMDDAYAQLSQSTLDVTKFDDTLIEGTITCQKAGLMYTSVPQSNGNWHVYVDGKEAQTVLIGDVMIGVMLEEGSHLISFHYKNQAFQTGLLITIVCALHFGALIVLDFVFKKKRKV